MNPNRWNRLVLAVATAAAGAAGVALLCGAPDDVPSLVLLATPARADAVDDAVDRFKEYLKTKPDAQGKRNAIAELALKKDPRVAKALTPLLARDPDEDVRIAVAQNIGKQKDLAVAPLLIRIAEDKKNRDSPKLVAACVEGVGDIDAKRFYKFLEGILRKYLPTSGEISSAAARGMANYPSADTVDDLIKHLNSANYVTTDDGAQKKASYEAVKPVIMEALQKVTGVPIKDPKVWNDWWKENERGWKPALPGDKGDADINASETYSDDAYGFEITKPSKAWAFRKGSGSGPYLFMEALDEGQKAAWIEISALGVKNLKSKTPEAMAQEQREHLEGSFRDIKEGAQWEHGTRVGGEKAVEQTLFGRHKDHDAVSMHNVYVEKNQVIFLLISFHKSGKSEALQKDIEKAFASFKFTR